MMSDFKVAMLGAGSGFVINIANDLLRSKFFDNTRFVLMDTNEVCLNKAFDTVRNLIKSQNSNIIIEKTTDRRLALEGCGYVITGCEQNRYPFWKKDIEIPEQFGVYQVLGENGGPGGQIHAMRNISLFMGILEDMECCCPDAWLLNFTNPMSFLCTYFKNYAKNPALGFCHQVHGSFGVIAEMLGFEPGELEVITGGINHFNWLVDIRKRGQNKSCMQEFLSKVRESTYWKTKHENIPRQEFTLEVLETFGAYPVGFDDHVIEYLPFFYEKDEWKNHNRDSIVDESLLPVIKKGSFGQSLEAMTLIGDAKGAYLKFPFPKKWNDPYYAEKPCEVIEALETNNLLYIDAINIVNNGTISNLPEDAIVDVPAVVKGGRVRGVHVGELPMMAAELCRRQITIHEMIAKATHEGDEKLVVQALCLDPYVRSITQAKKIWQAFRKEYIDYLPTFK